MSSLSKREPRRNQYTYGGAGQLQYYDNVEGSGDSRTPGIPPSPSRQWTLSYSPKVHGISLEYFYRHMERMPCPSILLIKDTEGTVFGALCMAQWRKSGKFCGNGESWVFTFGKHGYEKGSITVYPWSSKNEFFQYGDERRLVIGGGGKSGQSAICIYDSWLRGSTGNCLTYNSAPLASSEDFIIQDVEVWSLNTPEDD
ncbi:Oxidation resistance protein, putative [Perkinsus marinus ATCC 50983]|uniref:Oxidation resistance protein, putative n=1 Tax=Perkinsus marinus (strain ATCC 50983 / TXsc) TaxID=423536 RepID=C5K489_PERM5|nr:Oxidation resistance protein, putative [Perkinsus marinus ATCC 50983]EER20705.1 Oxidation resistance protein, putative [Perkinsus marinus ATCC 50983]|eukprot:XP_002788909.1 Oxidation resistance protein, putative [Perkinsus marinus ATCC 50983]